LAFGSGIIVRGVAFRGGWVRKNFAPHLENSRGCFGITTKEMQIASGQLKTLVKFYGVGTSLRVFKSRLASSARGLRAKVAKVVIYISHLRSL
jgi:hypothetical protein